MYTYTAACAYTLLPVPYMTSVCTCVASTLDEVCCLSVWLHQEGAANQADMLVQEGSANQADVLVLHGEQAVLPFDGLLYVPHGWFYEVL